MSVGARRAGVVGAVVGVAAAAATAGVAVERFAVGRARLGRDEYAAEPFGLLAADEELTVTAPDGVALHAEVMGRGEHDLTVVFVHGYCLDLGSWHFPRRALAAPRRRLVFYDQRGHGRSASGDQDHDTIDQLGRDLAAVIEATAPDGPLVLVGHSMGGMTVMALAEQQPALFRDRVVGVALLATSCGNLDDVSFGLPRVVGRVRKPLTPLVSRAMLGSAAVLERGRRAAGDLAWLLTRRYAFGSKHVSPALVDYAEQMIASTSVETVARFLATLSDHDRYEALAAFDGVETLVLAGDRDLMIPLPHNRRLAAALPGSEFVVVEGAGHLVQLERPDVVDAELAAFLDRAARAVAA